MTAKTAKIEKTFEDLRAEASVAQMQAMADKTIAEFDARMTFEHRERPGPKQCAQHAESAVTARRWPEPRAQCYCC